MAGDLPTAIREAKRLATIVDPTLPHRSPGFRQSTPPYFAALQYASPAEVLAMPAPDPRLTYVRAMHHYTRAVAFAQQRDERGFQRELAAMEEMRTSEALKPMVDQGVPAPDLVELAQHVARGRLAAARGRHAQAADHYRRAVALEDRIS